MRSAETSHLPEWSQTTVGEPAEWPPTLRMAAQIASALPGPVLVAWGRDAVVCACSPAMTALLEGFRPLARPLADVLDDAGPPLAPLVDRIMDGEVTDIEAAECALGTADAGRHRCRFTALSEAPDIVSGVLVAAVEAEAAAALLVETEHRMRNAFGVVRSLVRRMAATSDSVEDYAMHLEGRIDALTRVQILAPRDLAAGIDLETMVANELAAAGAQEGKQLDLDGPAIRIRPQAAATLALAMHELATNALKFGALAEPEGRVAVVWSVSEADGAAPTLHLEWAEAGMRQPPTPPFRRGFGTEMLERTLAYELRAQASRTVAPDGMHWQILLPLTDKVLGGPRD